MQTRLRRYNNHQWNEQKHYLFSEPPIINSPHHGIINKQRTNHITKVELLKAAISTQYHSKINKSIFTPITTKTKKKAR